MGGKLTMKKQAKKNRNTIYTLQPYAQQGQWQFDDPKRKLYGEALIAGIPEIIGRVCKERGIPTPEKGVAVFFSGQPFPDADIILEKLRPEYGGNWYRLKGTLMEGWLCESLYKYFSEAPQNIYIQIKKC